MPGGPEATTVGNPAAGGTARQSFQGQSSYLRHFGPGSVCT